MPDRRDPPPTDEGWFALHDFRSIDWDAWRDASDRTRTRALTEAIDHLETRLDVEDADEGGSALYSILGHKADFMLVHLRPTTAHLGALERQFEQTEFASFTERTTSFVSVTEASGYSEEARGYFEGGDVNPGLANYIQTRLKPTIPDATHVCFYPMSKRRDPGQNWYDLSFDERAEHMAAHGDIGRDYGGRVVQMITGAIALDDWEWGVTLWGDDLIAMKDLLYEMRFDPSTAEFAEFGQFYVGRRFPPSDLPALLSGDGLPAADERTPGALDAAGPIHPADAGEETDPTEATYDDDESGVHDGGPPDDADDEISAESADPEDMAARLVSLGFTEGEDYDPSDFAVLLSSNADARELAEEVDGLRGHFESYDSHRGTHVRAESGRSAVVSMWETERAAGIAEGFLSELPGVEQSLQGPLAGEGGASEAAHAAEESASIREELADLDVYGGQPHGEDIYALVLYTDAPLETLEDEVADLRGGFDRYDTHEGTKVYRDAAGDTAAVVSLWETQEAANTASGYLADLPGVIGWADEADGFGTMGMFYTVKPEHREDFVETFAEVGGLLEEMDGHLETALLANTADENDMFIASRWESKDDAMAFFRSDAFSETVAYGRDILADKPRHVFLA